MDNRAQLSPSERLLGNAHPRTMRADIKLLAGIYDELVWAREANTPAAPAVAPVPELPAEKPAKKSAK